MAMWNVSGAGRKNPQKSTSLDREIDYYKTYLRLTLTSSESKNTDNTSFAPPLPPPIPKFEVPPSPFPKCTDSRLVIPHRAIFKLKYHNQQLKYPHICRRIASSRACNSDERRSREIDVPKTRSESPSEAFSSSVPLSRFAVSCLRRRLVGIVSQACRNTTNFDLIMLNKKGDATEAGNIKAYHC